MLLGLGVLALMLMIVAVIITLRSSGVNSVDVTHYPSPVTVFVTLHPNAHGSVSILSSTPRQRYSHVTR